LDYFEENIILIEEVRKMKKSLFASIAMVFALLCLTATSSLASSVFGKVTFVGTIGEDATATNGYHAQFRFRVSNSTCDSDNVGKDRWIHVRSGRMDGIFAHNSANFRNAYNTVMTAFLSGKNIQVDGVPSCDSSKTQTINLWSSSIGIY
jgi:hypothetical protein